MSSVASYEVDWTDKHLAQQIDWRLTDVARHMMRAAFMGADGEAVLMHQLSGIGKLTCTTTGVHTVEVTVMIDGYDGRLGFVKEFCLGYGHLRNPNSPIQLYDGEPTSPSDLEGCPDRDALADGLRYLHESYIRNGLADSQSLAPVVQLDSYRLP